MSTHPVSSTILASVAILVLATAVCTAAEGESRSEWVARRTREWQSVLGPVRFSDPNLFDAMYIMNPQPEKTYSDIGKNVLAEHIKREHRFWIEKLFKEKMNQELVNGKPVAYYLNAGQDDPGLIVFHARSEERTVTMIENFNALLVTVKSDGIREHGIAKSALAKLIFESINLPYHDDSEVADKLRITETAKIGDVFTNSKLSNLGKLRNWDDIVFVIISKNGVSFLFLKAQANGAAKGLQYDLAWVNNGLYMEDGKTLVRPTPAPEP